jgi:hypothetical protein
MAAADWFFSDGSDNPSRLVLKLPWDSERWASSDFFFTFRKRKNIRRGDTRRIGILADRFFLPNFLNGGGDDSQDVVGPFHHFG